MVYIYALMSGQLVLYVGQTKRLKKREWEHRKRYSQCSKYIPDYMEWTMKVLEETTDTLGIQREQYFYDTLDPLYNIKRPGQTKEEYRQTGACKASRKAYYQTDTGKASQKASERAYQQTDAYKEYRRAFRQTDAYKEYQKAYYQRKKLKSVQD